MTRLETAGLSGVLTIHSDSNSSSSSSAGPADTISYSVVFRNSLRRLNQPEALSLHKPEFEIQHDASCASSNGFPKSSQVSSNCHGQLQFSEIHIPGRASYAWATKGGKCTTSSFAALQPQRVELIRQHLSLPWLVLVVTKQPYVVAALPCRLLQPFLQRNYIITTHAPNHHDRPTSGQDGDSDPAAEVLLGETSSINLSAARTRGDEESQFSAVADSNGTPVDLLYSCRRRRSCLNNFTPSDGLYLVTQPIQRSLLHKQLLDAVSPSRAPVTVAQVQRPAEEEEEDRHLDIVVIVVTTHLDRENTTHRPTMSSQTHHTLANPVGRCDDGNSTDTDSRTSAGAERPIGSGGADITQHRPVEQSQSPASSPLMFHHALQQQQQQQQPPPPPISTPSSSTSSSPSSHSQQPLPEPSSAIPDPSSSTPSYSAAFPASSNRDSSSIADDISRGREVASGVAASLAVSNTSCSSQRGDGPQHTSNQEGSSLSGANQVCQEFHGTLGSPQLTSSGIRARHLSGGELAAELRRQQQQQQHHHQHQHHVYHHHKLPGAQQLPHHSLQSQSGFRPSFYGSAPFLTQGSTVVQSSSTCGVTISVQSKTSPSSSSLSSSSSSSSSSTATTVALTAMKEWPSSSSSSHVMMEEEDHQHHPHHQANQRQRQQREEEKTEMDVSDSGRYLTPGVRGMDDNSIQTRRSPALGSMPRSYSGGNISDFQHQQQHQYPMNQSGSMLSSSSSSLSSSSSSFFSFNPPSSTCLHLLPPPPPLLQVSPIPSSSHHHALVANLPEIQMTEMVSEADQAAPWMSHTPDNLSPTVQIVQKLAQAVVSDKRSVTDSGSVTTSPGDTSPRTSKLSGLQIPTPDRSPSLSPTSATKQRQLFVFPDVSHHQPQNKSAAGASITAPPTLESAGLNVTLAALKSERWRHVSSGSSGDSSTAGDNITSGATSASKQAGQQPPGGVGSAGGTGSSSKRYRFFSGDTDIDDTLVDSETGSSVVEDSESSREQSPFSLGPENIGIGTGFGGHHSPRQVSPSSRKSSPSGRKNLHRQYGMASEDDADVVGGIHPSSSSSGISEGERGGQTGDEDRLQPPKFKRRLHERYVSSLKDEPPLLLSRSDDSSYGLTTASSSDSAIDVKPVVKLEAVDDDPDLANSSLPKSPRRSVAEDSQRADSYELSADEGDVFMEPVRVSPQQQQQHRTKSRHQQKPLDLSHSTPCTPVVPHGFHFRSGSLPDSDTPTSSPGAKSHYSPFRSPYRLNFSPHGLMSPQSSQSPLCSVPEGGRIFNFNMPTTPYETGASSSGGQSDSDVISPSPVSPRFFTFPSVPPGQLHHQLFPSSPLHLPLKAQPLAQFKWESLSKRSLSDSDVAYQCPICFQAFASNDNLAKHMAKHLPTETVRSGDNNKIHYCKVCDRSFSRSDMLTRHMRLHTGLKPYECLDCGQVFSRSDHLNTHKRTHTGEKPYRCPQCPYAACRRDMITRHMRTHTKRTPKRNRYLSVPDDSTMSGTSSGGGQEGGGGGGRTSSVSSTENSESSYLDPYTGGGRACSSLSSIDSLDLEMGVASGVISRGRLQVKASCESLPLTDESLQPTTHASTSSHDSEELEDFANPATWMAGRKSSSSALLVSPGYATGSRCSSTSSHYGKQYGGGGAGDDEAFLHSTETSSSSSTSTLTSHYQLHHQPQQHHHHQQEKRPREPSPHPRGYLYQIPPPTPP